MIDELVEKLNSGNFNQGSAIFKNKYYKRKTLIVQHLLVKERGRKNEINRMRNGYNLETLTSVGIQEISKFGGKVIKIYEGVIHQEKSKISPFRKIIHKLSALRRKYKEENIAVMQLLVKVLMNNLHGEQIRKVIEEKFACKSEYWMRSEYYERVKEQWRISPGNYIVKMIDDGFY